MITGNFAMMDGSIYTTVPAPPGCGLVGQVRLAPGVELETYELK